ncbi:MAG: YdcF family protein [Bacteroidia bacterium]
MFYFLSKVLYGIVAPVSLVLIMFIIYFISGIKKWIYWAFGLMLFFSNPFIAQTVMGWYEIDPIRIEKGKKYDGIIILGGFISNVDVDGENRAVFSDGNDRMMQALYLFKNKVSNRIIYTAGRDTIFTKYSPEALLGKEYLMKSGIPDTCIWAEIRSINTFENAYLTKEMLQKKDPNWKKKEYLILTSAFHMRRAMACFEKQGFQVTAYSTDMRSSRSKFSVLNTIMPTYGGFEIWTFLLKEWIGLVVYQLKGYI